MDRRRDRGQDVLIAACRLSFAGVRRLLGGRRSLRIEVITMLADSLLVTTVATTDLERARRFFGEQLGLPLLDEAPFALRFGAGHGGQVSVRRGQPNVGQTVGHFEVYDIEAVIADLTSRGVEFQEYETPKTVNFIAQIGPARGAWFTDPDGNVFGVREGPVPADRRAGR